MVQVTGAEAKNQLSSLLDAVAFLAEASAPLAISSWSVTELHSSLGLKVRTKALSQAQAEAVLQGFERSLAPNACPWPSPAAGGTSACVLSQG